MEIRWLGQSAFEIKTNTATIVCDPSGSYTSTDPNTVVVLSRRDGRPAALPESANVFDRPGEYEVAGVSIRGVGTPAVDRSGARQVNTVFVLFAEGVAVCTLGLPAEVTDAQANQMIGPVDVMLVRTDGQGMTLEQRASAVRALEPKVVIPSGFDPSGSSPTLTKFLAQLGVKQFEAQPRFSISKSGLAEGLKVVVLAPRA